ncbi:hypothetical protein B6U81_06590 [Thermoplasmatales archaeon ex4484_30]|nr:MAG: hypothetical protein B6U81_06590 [Thermoplasmatales archaeon ex4484_30]
MEEILKLFDDYISFILDEKGNFISINNFDLEVEGSPFIQIFEGEEKKKAAKLFLDALKNGKAGAVLKIRKENVDMVLSFKIVKYQNLFYGIAKEIRRERPSFITDFLGNVIEADEKWKSMEGKNIYDLVEEKEKLSDILSDVIEKGEYEGKIIINERKARVKIKATECLEFFIEEDFYTILEKILRSRDVDEIVNLAVNALEAIGISYSINLMGREKGMEIEEAISFPILRKGENVGSLAISEADEEKIHQINFLLIAISHALESLEDVSKIINDFAFYKISKEGKILYANTKFEELTGYRAGDIEGKNVDEFAERREEFFENMKEGKIENFVSKWKGKNREFIALEQAWTLNGEILVLIKDITSEKEKEKDAEFYNSILRHDIYNKNEIALGYIGLMEKTNLTKKQKELLKKVKDVLKEAGELIKNVRKAEEIRKAKKELHPIKLKDVIKAVCPSYEEIAEKKGISLSCNVDDVIVVADEFIGEVFSNLIKNAVEHSECSQINVYGEEEGRFYKVYIEDNGKGIEEQDIEKIFEEGWKKGGGGSGLGLYIVKKLMERYGGKVEVESKVGKGTKFILYFKIPKKEREFEILRIRF